MKTKLYTASAILTCGSVVGIVLSHGPSRRYVISWILNKLSACYHIRNENMRSHFNAEEIVEMKPDPRHTHGVSAAYRSTGSLFIDQYCKGLGIRPWYYQRSRADERCGRIGSREYYWVKDLAAKPAAFYPHPRDVIAMVDVDQYVDMPKFLNTHFKPVILYTFQPTSVSRIKGDYKFTFDCNDQVVYSVSGGAPYKHKVWNYNVDNIKVSSKFLGITYKITTYLVDRRVVDRDHQIILLTPVKRFSGLSALLAADLHGSELERLKVAHGDYLRLLVNTKDELNVSTGKVNDYLSIDVPISTDSYISSIAKTCKVGLMFAQVKSKVGVDNDGAAILYEYHLAQINALPTMIFPLDPYVRGYQFKPNKYDPEAKRSMSSFMKPIIDGAFCPDLTSSNEEQAVKGRIIDVRTDTSECVVDTFFLKCVDEFVTMLLGDCEGHLHPVDYEEVYERQCKPSQRAILHQSEYMNPHRVNKGFIKREAYQKCSDPRIISTVNGTDKMNYSMFIYSFSKILKNQDWYAFGKTPLEVSIRVAEILRHAKFGNNTDFSRWDGHVSQAFRYLEKQAMMRAFRPEYRQQLWELQKTQYGLPCVMSLGTKFEGNFERLSGSAETSDFNSMDDAFTAYLGFRMSISAEGRFMSPDEAWSMLGIYGGDDGLTPDLDPQIYVKAAKKLGQNLTIETIKRGEVGISFLSRFYGPDVWYGDLSSMCDIKRTLMKFHVTVNLPHTISPQMKLMDKSFAYSLTDLNTPIIGDFVRQVVKYLPKDYVFHNYMGSWNAQFIDITVQYPNVYGTWMLELVKCKLPDFNLSKFIDWIIKPRTVSELMEPPLCMERIIPETKEPVVLDGDILYPINSKQTKSTQPHNAKVRTRGRRQRKSDVPKIN